jgi:hypothetical protein
MVRLKLDTTYNRKTYNRKTPYLEDTTFASGFVTRSERVPS